MIQGALSNFASEQNEKFMKTKNSNKKLTLCIGALFINFSAHGATDKPCGEGVRMLTQNCC